MNPKTPNRRPEHSALIDALDGPKAVAERINTRSGRRLTPQAVSMWRRRGIPWRWRLPVAREAAELAVALPKGFLNEEPPEPAPEPVKNIPAAEFCDEVPFLNGGA